jgi:hypothetical protein
MLLVMVDKKWFEFLLYVNVWMNRMLYDMFILENVQAKPHKWL